MRSYKSLILFIFLPIILLIVAFYNITLVIDHKTDSDECEYNMDYISRDNSYTDYAVYNTEYNTSVCNNITCDYILKSGTYENNQELNTNVLISIILDLIKDKNIFCLNILKCDYIILNIKKKLHENIYSNQITKDIQIYFSSNVVWVKNFINISDIYRLVFYNNEITNVTFLNNFLNLEDLDLSLNPINNLHELSLSKLKLLRLQNIYNNINAQYLNKFINLSSLDLSYNLHIKNLNKLYIQHLQILYLSKCNITNDITFLNKFKHLQLLDLSFNFELNSDALINLNIKNLNILNLNDCNITTTKFIYNFKKLSILDLSQNKKLVFLDIINDNIQKLYLRNTNIINVFIINNFRNLLGLDLSENKNMIDLHTLNISSLRKLYLYNCNIKNINHINNIDKLSILDLGENIDIDINSDKLKKFNCNSSSIYYTEKICNDSNILFNY